MPTILLNRQPGAESSQPIRKTRIQTALSRFVEDEHDGVAGSERVLTSRRPAPAAGMPRNSAPVFGPVTSPIGRPELVPLLPCSQTMETEVKLRVSPALPGPLVRDEWPYLFRSRTWPTPQRGSATNDRPTLAARPPWLCARGALRRAAAR